MKIKFWSLLLAPLIASILFGLLVHLGLSQPAAIVTSITMLTVTWWVTSALPIPVTSLLPFILFPTFGIFDHSKVASFIGSDVILLLMGAFMLSKSLEKSGAHEKLAFYILKSMNANNVRRLVLGIMSTTAFLSMWISNTAATLVMLPITLAILNTINNKKVDAILLLSIAYAASLGGIGTLLGSPTNIIFDGMYKQQVGVEFNFFDWLKMGLPILLISIPLGSYWLTRHVNNNINISLPSSRSWTTSQKRTLAIFGGTIVAWATIHAPAGGWSQWLHLPLIGDSSVVLIAVVIMFIISDGNGGKLMDWETAKNIPWGVLLLTASGLCIASAFHSSGLSHVLASHLQSLTHLSPLIMLLVMCLCITFFTEFASNTATATLLMPIMASAAVATGSEPQLLMAPTAMAASTAFMFPVGTPPNAIIFGSGKVPMKTMMSNGIMFSLILTILISIICFLTV